MAMSWARKSVIVYRTNRGLESKLSSSIFSLFVVVNFLSLSRFEHCPDKSLIWKLYKCLRMAAGSWMFLMSLIKMETRLERKRFCIIFNCLLGRRHALHLR